MIAIRDRVRFEETDLMAVVYHSRYLPWMEMGRVAWLRACGVDLNRMMDEGILFPIREINVKYNSTGRRWFFRIKWLTLKTEKCLWKVTLPTCSRIKTVKSFAFRQRGLRRSMLRIRKKNRYRGVY